MAEFMEVTRHVVRMCTQYVNNCEGCPLHDKYGRCPLEDLPEDWKPSAFADIERLVMDWTAAHQKPKYPTWCEVWDRLFPKRAETLPPCPKYFVEKERINDFCPGLKCTDCRNRPIDADIAKKLGIPPIGGAQ